jgi:hypothetical protein
MTSCPVVRIVGIEHGPLEQAGSLNRKIPRDRPLLRATLDIVWNEPDPAAALGRIEALLAGFSPSFHRHECRGPAGYRVFSTRPRTALAGAGPDVEPAQPFDARLSLAHLIEHAVIDFESTITRQTRISGLTGARRRPPGRFDVMVECPDPVVGRLCLALAVWATTGAADARPPGRREHDILATARLAHRRSRRVFTSSTLARAFDWPCDRAAAALSCLEEFGYLRPLPYAMNFSGLPYYAVAPA